MRREASTSIQDTAGRLLESMGDHARREMIVRTTQVVRQNPAYRPIARNATASDGTSSEAVCFHQLCGYGRKVNTLRGRTSSLFVVCLLVGCSSARTVPPGSPVPAIPPPPVVASPSASSWTFSHAPGAMRYQVSRSAAIESLSDSNSRHEVSSNITHELITLAPGTDSGIVLRATVDTFATTTQGLIGPVQSAQLPIEVSGVFTADSLVIGNDTVTNAGKCNPIRSTLVSDLHNLLARFPAQLTPGLAWRDSVNSAGCQAAIPTTSQTTRSFLVSGEAVYEGRPVLLIQRSDTIQAHGEGAQQQHPLKLDASGTGSAVYYLNTTDGRVIRLTSGQELILTITTSSKLHRFKQSSRQDFRLLP
jgi:hypothetical protein